MILWYCSFRNETMKLGWLDGPSLTTQFLAPRPLLPYLAPQGSHARGRLSGERMSQIQVLMTGVKLED